MKKCKEIKWAIVERKMPGLFWEMACWSASDGPVSTRASSPGRRVGRFDWKQGAGRPRRKTKREGKQQKCEWLERFYKRRRKKKTPCKRNPPGLFVLYIGVIVFFCYHNKTNHHTFLVFVHESPFPTKAIQEKKQHPRGRSNYFPAMVE